MEREKQQLRGSSTRDDFKFRHKHMLSKDCYAVDVDLAWIGKRRVLAFFDYKTRSDTMNKNEHIAYAALSDIAPFFLITECAPDTFRIDRLVREGSRNWTKIVKSKFDQSWDDLQKLHDALALSEA